MTTEQLSPDMTDTSAPAPAAAPEAVATSASAVSGSVGPGLPPKKRRRPALSCEQCRRRKIRCDRNLPCNHCVKSGAGTACRYIPTHTPLSRKKTTKSTLGRKKKDSKAPDVPVPRHIDSYQQRQQRPLTILPTPESNKYDHGRDSDDQESHDNKMASTENVDWLVTHIEERMSRTATIDKREITVQKHLRDRQAQSHSLQSHPSPSQPQPQTGSSLASAPTPGLSSTASAAKCPVSRIKYLGRSHWMHGVGLFTQEMRLMHPSGDGDPELLSLLGRCKSVGRKVKERRQAPLSSIDLGKTMVPRHVADDLVEAYLRTFEGVFRIVHVPTFRELYQMYWRSENDESARPATCAHFIMQLQLVMALGSVIHDAGFSLRSQAARWVYEAQLWLILPPGKDRMTIPGIQNMCLLTLARSVCGVDQDLAWITAGDLIRKAICMGLHRDPRHLGIKTRHRAEMRRRLWATIVELNLQSAFDAGGPPLMGGLDNDVQLPGNFDDEELSDQVPDDEESRVDSRRRSGDGGSKDHGAHGSTSGVRVTQMSVPLQLLESLPLRLRLLQHVNDFRADDSYDETLRFNSELTRACRRISRCMVELLHASSSASAATSSTSPSSISLSSSPSSPSHPVREFHTAVAELLVYRCFHTLHQPIIVRSLEDPKFHFSRKMHLDGALKMMHLCRLSGPRREEGPGGQVAPGTTDLDRLLVNGAGMFRNMTIQSVPGLVIELLQAATTTVPDGGDRNRSGAPSSQSCPSTGAHALSLGYLPAVDDFDLRATVEACLRLCLRRIEAGETNIKCAEFGEACLAHVDAAAAGLDKQATEAFILQAIKASATKALEALNRLAEREGVSPEPSSPNSAAATPLGKVLRQQSNHQQEQEQQEQQEQQPSHDGFRDDPTMSDLISDPISIDVMNDWMWGMDAMDGVEGMLWGSPPQPMMGIPGFM
ncbi:Fungal trans [Geosmithia morbida]|uniref:Fungal trans n=1 Tax=Geosmithia morbida TaxID=1094350 RepID=A0A9P5D6A0_9HYPO|nr:Fungal trans [Geosmithia morbida]KAF4125401.1 Fungal trans [Geosmithia morbida]